MNEQTILFEIQKTLGNRLETFRQQTTQAKPSQNSYVEQLYQQGINKMGKKIIEEAGEVLMAAKDCEHNNTKNQQQLVNEITDLWFHCMVLLTYYDGDINQVMTEARRRFGLSGLDEKKTRSDEKK